MKMILFALLFNVTSFAVQERGGGSVQEMEFKKYAQMILIQLKEREVKDSELGFRLALFEKAIKEIKVAATKEEITIDGEHKDAENRLSARKIIFNIYWWSIMNAEQKKMLAIHEHLRFVGVDDSGYAYTFKVMQILKINIPETQAMPRLFKVIAINNNWKGDTNIRVRVNETETSGVVHCGNPNSQNSRINIQLGTFIFYRTDKNFSYEKCKNELTALSFKLQANKKIYLGINEENEPFFTEE